MKEEEEEEKESACRSLVNMFKGCCFGGRGLGNDSPELSERRKTTTTTTTPKKSSATESGDDKDNGDGNGTGGGGGLGGATVAGVPQPIEGVLEGNAKENGIEGGGGGSSEDNSPKDKEDSNGIFG